MHGILRMGVVPMILGAALLAGCATRDDLRNTQAVADMARAQAEQARATADQAIAAAQAAANGPIRPTPPLSRHSRRQTRRTPMRRVRLPPLSRLTTT